MFTSYDFTTVKIVDGAVDDMFEKNKEFTPKFLRRYADLHTLMTDSIGRYIADVKSGDFPNENER